MGAKPGSSVRRAGVSGSYLPPQPLVLLFSLGPPFPNGFLQGGRDPKCVKNLCRWLLKESLEILFII